MPRIVDPPCLVSRFERISEQVDREEERKLMKRQRGFPGAVGVIPYKVAFLFKGRLVLELIEPVKNARDHLWR